MAAVEDYPFLLPHPDRDSAPYWEAALRHELVVQRCAACRRLRHPPRTICPYCLKEGAEWERMCGRGEIYTFVVISHAVLPQWRGITPYNVAEISLEEDPSIRIVGNIVGDGVDQPSRLRCGLPVEVTFDDVVESVTIPRWRLRQG